MHDTYIYIYIYTYVCIISLTLAVDEQRAFLATARAALFMTEEACLRRRRLQESIE